MRGAWLFGAIVGIFAAQLYLLICIKNFFYQESSSVNSGSREKESGSDSVYLPKTLLFITSHFSESHNMFLTNCWPHSIAKSKLIQNSDILVLSTGPANMTLLRTIFNNNKLEVHEVPNPGYQAGAILALMYAFENNLFESYDWVIRLNPDVIIRDDTKIIAGIIEPAFDGIFVNCKQNGKKLHTDWSAFRPSAIPFNKTNFTKLNEIGNAEEHFTFLMSAVLESGKIQWLPGARPKRPGMCMILGDSVVHYHQYLMDCELDIETDSIP